MDKKRPNIVVFFTDQQRWDTIDERVAPNLCAMASEGTTFDDAFTCQPVCGPARACIQTGVYATRNGCITNAVPLDEDADTIAKILGRNGYDTAYVGKWHLASGQTESEGRYETTAVPERRRGGYRYWRAADVLEYTSDGTGGFVFDEDGNKLTFEGCRADRLTDYAVEYIEQTDRDKPFFLFVSYLEPHHQNTSGRFECMPDDRRAVEQVPVPPDLLPFKGNYEDNYTDYLGCCHGLDRNFRRVVDALKANGAYDDTVIFFTSDHGCHFMTRNGEYKRSCHEVSIHIPMFAFGGAYPKGEKSGALVSLLDLPASVVAAAGVEVPSYFDGKDMAKICAGQDSRDAVYIQISEDKLGRAVRTERYTYAIKSPRKSDAWGTPYSDVYVEDYLYDLDVDPCETRNLIHDRNYQSVKAELAATLKRCAAKAGEPPFKIRYRLIAPKK